ncbi:hypothetical protein ARNL5_02280 [Anaerolineae bacterium]|nr:hypothetical protein ARNL5_02280 [Anaerolineae bacterium]
MVEEKERIDCLHCVHFYITWDERAPRGCKAMGFKSKEAPSAVVLRSSGMRCQMFEEKKGRKGRSGP